ncbi:HEAT repeat domain-containing protein [Chloroflexota bacterium]
MKNTEFNNEIPFNEMYDNKDIEGLIDIVENTKIENSKTKNTVAQAIYLLGELKADKAVDPLVYIALKNNRAKVRHAAILALGEIGNERAVKPLIMLLKDLDIKESELKDEDHSYQSDDWMAKALFEALFNIGTKKVIKDIVETLDCNSGLTDIAFLLLKEMGEKGIKPLIYLLESDGQVIREKAIIALGELGEKSKEAAGSLIHILEMLQKSEIKDFEQMERVVVALGKVGDSKATGPLIKILKSDPLHTDDDYSLQCSTVTALGELGDKQAAELIVHLMLEGTELRLRGTATWALGQIRDDKAIEPLIKVLTNKREDSWVQRCAFRSLFNYDGDIVAIPILRYLKLNPEIIKHQD